MIGPFVFWDHMGPVELQGDREMLVRAHPHIGLATITYLFSGKILHRDSLGNEQWIYPGEVNWMTAGRGIVHSERARYDERTTLEGIQLWLALPKDSEEVEPSFVHHKEFQLPLIEGDGYEMRLIAGSFLGKQSPIKVYSSLFYLKGRLKQAQWSYQLSMNDEAGIYIISGNLTVDAEIYGPGTLVVFNVAQEILISADYCEFMIFGGEMFPEGRHVWWNFVSSSKKRIEEAKQSWKNGEFPAVVNETLYIPLPE